jgi:hypothetical protein
MIRTAPAVYLARLRVHPVQNYLPSAKSDPYPGGVAEAIALSVDAVTASDLTGLCRDLLDIVSLLSTEGVSRRILYLGESAGVWAAGEGECDEALARLAEASLLTFSGDGSVIAHRLVMRVLRERAVHDNALAALGAKAARLLDACTHSLGEVWQHPAEARECVRHGVALADHLTALSAEAEPTALLSLRESARRGDAAACVGGRGPRAGTRGVASGHDVLAEQPRVHLHHVGASR